MNIKRYHPGEYIKDSLEALSMTNKEFAIRTDISERTLSDVINGKGSITFDIAYKLAAYFDNDVDFWMNLQTSYNLYMREQEEKKLAQEEYNLACSASKYLIKSHYLLVKPSKDEIVETIRKVVGVNSLLSLKNKDVFACFKEVKTSSSNNFIQNFWIALALKEARQVIEHTYDNKKLISLIPEFRKMIKQDPEVFYPKLKSDLAECGVSFVLLPYMQSSNIYGVTKWLSSNNVMLAMSNRDKKVDTFWFTFFHELSHVLLEHKRNALVNIKGHEDKDADTAAKNILISPVQWENFISKKDFSKNAIIKFANSIDTLPCIVLGRLHNEKYLPYAFYTKELSEYYDMVI